MTMRLVRVAAPAAATFSGGSFAGLASLSGGTFLPLARRLG
jgi:hypothetical protein